MQRPVTLYSARGSRKIRRRLDKILSKPGVETRPGFSARAAQTPAIVLPSRARPYLPCRKLLDAAWISKVS